MNRTLVKRLATFAILMETGDGIITKSPTYMLEKWELVNKCPIDLLHTLLDPQNNTKLNEYLRIWIVTMRGGDIHE